MHSRTTSGTLIRVAPIVKLTLSKLAITQLAIANGLTLTNLSIRPSAIEKILSIGLESKRRTLPGRLAIINACCKRIHNTAFVTGFASACTIFLKVESLLGRLFKTLAAPQTNSELISKLSSDPAWNGVTWVRYGTLITSSR